MRCCHSHHGCFHTPRWVQVIVSTSILLAWSASNLNCRITADFLSSNPKQWQFLGSNRAECLLIVNMDDFMSKLANAPLMWRDWSAIRVMFQHFQRYKPVYTKIMSYLLAMIAGAALMLSVTVEGKQLLFGIAQVTFVFDNDCDQGIMVMYFCKYSREMGADFQGNILNFKHCCVLSIWESYSFWALLSRLTFCVAPPRGRIFCSATFFL